MKVEVAVLGCPSLLFISLTVSVDVKRHLVIIIVQCCSASKETIRTIRDREPWTTTSAFTQLLGYVLQFCFTSTETIRTIRDRESPGRPPRLAFTQLPSSEHLLHFRHTRHLETRLESSWE